MNNNPLKDPLPLRLLDALIIGVFITLALRPTNRMSAMWIGMAIVWFAIASGIKRSGVKWGVGVVFLLLGVAVLAWSYRTEGS